ncbi:hypothetical protein PFISCL1PPCAC_13610, partial [Pristionchus fissidentatus]
QLCPKCDWIERQLNFGVVDEQTANTNGITTITVVFVFAIFIGLCFGHIVYELRKHHQLSSQSAVRMSSILRQTKQALVQIGLFGIFLALPTMLLLSPLIFEVTEEVQLPALLLFSSNSFVNSVAQINGTPAFRSFFRPVSRIGANQISSSKL